MAKETTKARPVPREQNTAPQGQPGPWPEVLTLEEAAAFLRLSSQKVEELGLKGDIPGRRVEQTWLFLRKALEEWLLGKDGRTAWLKFAGAFADDETLPQIRAAAYEARGRPEVEEGEDR
jgi:excisionase family DNA binding protein